MRVRSALTTHTPASIERDANACRNLDPFSAASAPRRAGIRKFRLALSSELCTRRVGYGRGIHHLFLRSPPHRRAGQRLRTVSHRRVNGSGRRANGAQLRATHAGKERDGLSQFSEGDLGGPKSGITRGSGAHGWTFCRGEPSVFFSSAGSSKRAGSTSSSTPEREREEGSVRTRRRTLFCLHASLV